MKRHPTRHRGKKNVLWISQRPSCLLRKVGEVNHLTLIQLYYHCISWREEYRRQPSLQHTLRTELCSSATGFQSEVLLTKAVSSMPFADGNVSFFFFSSDQAFPPKALSTSILNCSSLREHLFTISVPLLKHILKKAHISKRTNLPYAHQEGDPGSIIFQITSPKKKCIKVSRTNFHFRNKKWNSLPQRYASRTIIPFTTNSDLPSDIAKRTSMLLNLRQVNILIYFSLFLTATIRY